MVVVFLKQGVVGAIIFLTVLLLSSPVYSEISCPVQEENSQACLGGVCNNVIVFMPPCVTATGFKVLDVFSRGMEMVQLQLLNDAKMNALRQETVVMMDVDVRLLQPENILKLVTDYVW